MGTRSLTCFVDEDGEEFVTMYRQFDGYPSGHGADLAEFLSGIRMVNGIPLSDQGKVRMANGMGCLAAQVVAYFKTDAGGIYLHKPNTRDVGEEYIYMVSGVEGREPRLRVYMYYTEPNELLFDGAASDYAAWLQKSEESEDA